MVVQLHELMGVGILSGWPDTSMYLCKHYVQYAMSRIVAMRRCAEWRNELLEG